MSYPDGENSIILSAGANHAFQTIPQSWFDAIKEADILLLQREIPEWVNESLSESAKFVVLDVGGDSNNPISEALIKNLDIISPNETELQCVI